MNRVLIVGAGGLGREVLDIVEACISGGQDLEFVGFLDDGAVDAAALARRGAVHLGLTELIGQLEAAIVIGIGSPSVRRKIDERVMRAGNLVITVAHPSASVGADNRIGPGAVLCAGSRMTTNITVGRHFHLNLNSTVGHDCVIGNYVSVFPGATISGDVQLGDGVTIGTGANVIQGITIGEGTTVGAGAVVVRDLPANVTAVGSPARPLQG